MKSISASVAYQVGFHDLDLMQIVWHGHYFRFFELARTELMKKLELDWPILKKNGFAMPVVDFKVKYRRAIEYHMPLVIEAAIVEFDTPALDIHYKILDHSSGEVMATATSRQSYFNYGDQRTCYSVPEMVLERFEAYVESQS